MNYKSIVLIKQVPDTQNITGDVMKEDGTINRAAMPAIYNPDDLNALEMALSLKDRFGGTVTFITMGPPRSSEILRESLYRGADDVILLSDKSFAGADTLATAKTLSKAIQKVDDYDFIFCGRQAIDGDTAQVGPQVAAHLNIPHVTFVDNIEKVEDNTITLKRLIEDGFEIIQTKAPALITVMDSANEPRYPSCKLMMQYKKAVSPAELGNNTSGQKSENKNLLIKTWGAQDINIPVSECGSNGSPTRVAKVESVQLLSKDIKLINADIKSIRGLISELISEHILG